MFLTVGWRLKKGKEDVIRYNVSEVREFLMCNTGNCITND
jgi:hypothetical protein